MTIALITTTIHVPYALKNIEQTTILPRIIIAGDRNTPVTVAEFVQSLRSTQLLLPDEQTQWKCSELIGWNCIQRRNIALLEAVKTGADLIVTWDTDNYPLAPSYLLSFATHFSVPFNGLKAESRTSWFDQGSLLVPPVKQRGVPYLSDGTYFETVVGAKVGVASGLVLGDSDMDGATRLVNAPNAHSVNDLGRVGIVSDPRDTWTVFNSQNTAFLRELAPAMFMMPGVGRFDDIYASLITQRIMRELNLYVHIGQPFVFQQRHTHNLFKDIRAEIDGMENVERMGQYLDMMTFRTRTVVEQVREIYQGFDSLPLSYELVPKDSVKAALAFLEDIEAIL